MTVQHGPLPLQDRPLLPAIDARLKEIFRQTFKQENLEILPETDIHAIPGFDSIRLVSLLLAVEEAYGVILQASVVRRLTTIGDLNKALDGDTGNKPRSGHRA